ncbi:MAG: 3-dehydroquinate synthase [Planctomycetota bacterium]
MESSEKNSPGQVMNPPLVILAGFMGTGKTATGQALAGLLGRTFMDTDQVIEEREQMTVEEIFSRHGEAHFREREAALVQELTRRSGLVVATGGGMLLNEMNFKTLSRLGPVYLLHASIDAILTRIHKDSTRPLVKSGKGSKDARKKVESLLKAREAVYARVPRQIDTTDIDPHETACRIAGSLDLSSHTLTLLYPAGTLPSAQIECGNKDAILPGSVPTYIEIGCGLLSSLGSRLKSLGHDSRAFVLIPEKVKQHHLGQVAESLNSASIPWEEIIVKDRDREKSLDQAGDLISRLAEKGASRDSVILAVGGGVTGDLAGFVASIYMRGMPFVQVPTTLLAQVDAGMGGKTGVNHKHAKNLVGSFYPARLVLSDPCTLRTLPQEELANGMAEVVKTAIIGSPDLYDQLIDELSKTASAKLKEIPFLEACVKKCAAVKTAIVTRDPFEKDERRLLNLGHTVGHAFEAMDDYTRYSHGQAISLGMVAVLHIARARGMATKEFVIDTVKILEQCGLPVTFPSMDKTAFLQSLNLDKKKMKGRIHFILPERPGACVIKDDVTEDEIFAAVSA